MSAERLLTRLETAGPQHSGRQSLGAVVKRLRRIQELMPDRHSPPYAAATIVGFANMIADELERNAEAPLENAAAALIAVLRAYKKLAYECVGSFEFNASSVDPRHVFQASKAALSASALKYVGLHLPEIVKLALGEQLHREYSELASALFVSERGPMLCSVEKMGAHYRRIAKLGEAIRECCEGDPKGSDVLNGKLGLLDVMQTFGEGVFFRLLTKRPADQMSLWTPLGSLTMHQCEMSNASFKRMMDRFGLTPCVPHLRVPFWTGSDTLYAVGRDADGVSFPTPRQCEEEEALPDFMAQTVWERIQIA